MIISGSFTQPFNVTRRHALTQLEVTASAEHRPDDTNKHNFGHVAAVECVAMLECIQWLCIIQASQRRSRHAHETDETPRRKVAQGWNWAYYRAGLERQVSGGDREFVIGRIDQLLSSLLSIAFFPLISWLISPFCIQRRRRCTFSTDPPAVSDRALPPCLFFFRSIRTLFSRAAVFPPFTFSVYIAQHSSRG